MAQVALKDETNEETFAFKGVLLKRLKELALKNDKPLRHYIVDILAEHCEDMDDGEAAENNKLESKGKTFSLSEIRIMHGLAN